MENWKRYQLKEVANEPVEFTAIVRSCRVARPCKTYQKLYVSPDGTDSFQRAEARGFELLERLGWKDRDAEGPGKELFPNAFYLGRIHAPLGTAELEKDFAEGTRVFVRVGLLARENEAGTQRKLSPRLVSVELYDGGAE